MQGINASSAPDAVAPGRRRFLLTAASVVGGLSVGWSLPGRVVQALAQGTGAAPAAGTELGIWAVVHPDDTVVVRIARSEMGQGTLTGLAQLVADEMDADWSKVRTEFVTPEANLAAKRAWGDMSTGGSRGLRGSVEYVRKGGAAARAMLVQAAAQQWGVPAAECSARDSKVSHAASGRTLRYGELAPAAARLPVPADPKVKDQKDWRLIGQPLARLDTAEKVNGAQLYAIDVRLPGMLQAAIAQCPVFGGKLKGFEAAKVSSMPGVRHVVPVGETAVAVVADTWWQAKTALAELPVQWDEGANGEVSSASILQFVREGLSATSGLQVGNEAGEVDAALAGAAKRVTAEYACPFVNHATLEPMNCTALVQGDRVEVWVGSQNGEASLAAAAEAAGVPTSNVKVNKYVLGGGFGRRGFQDYTRQAVAIAKQVPGRPVKLIWSREEDMQHGFYRPVTACRLEGGLDAQGKLVALRMRLAGQSILAGIGMDGGVDRVAFQGLGREEFGYMAIPNFRLDYAMRNTHVPVGFWRGVNHNQNAFFLECFMDELALAAGRDPLEFRRAVMGRNPKHLAVLDAVAAKIGWDAKPAEGVHRGICMHAGFGSYMAAAAEVSVSPQGEVKVRRIVAGLDPGIAVNPDQIQAQTEGAVAYGLGAMLHSENTIERGRVVEGNFDSYEVLRLAEMPKVEGVLVPSGGFWGGVGEPTIAVAAPAVLNAVYAATGKRVRSMPLKRHDLRSA